MVRRQFGSIECPFVSPFSVLAEREYRKSNPGEDLRCLFYFSYSFDFFLFFFFLLSRLRGASGEDDEGKKKELEEVRVVWRTARITRRQDKRRKGRVFKLLQQKREENGKRKGEEGDGKRKAFGEA